MDIPTQTEDEYVDITFYDLQGLGVLPENLSNAVSLMTKISMGVVLIYFSLNELVVELKKYRENSLKETK